MTEITLKNIKTFLIQHLPSLETGNLLSSTIKRGDPGILVYSEDPPRAP
ncbi:unnamed protein product [marine sediment metagenome]|uniref:Uncharacterized protein n=1 Tax=marine sediment metagenome TaxID=412755 RepID=X1GK12_9ZZZZ